MRAMHGDLIYRLVHVLSYWHTPFLEKEIWHSSHTSELKVSNTRACSCSPCFFFKSKQFAKMCARGFQWNELENKWCCLRTTSGMLWAGVPIANSANPKLKTLTLSRDKVPLCTTESRRNSSGLRGNTKTPNMFNLVVVYYPYGVKRSQHPFIGHTRKTSIRHSFGVLIILLHVLSRLDSKIRLARVSIWEGWEKARPTGPQSNKTWQVLMCLPPPWIAISGVGFLRYQGSE